MTSFASLDLSVIVSEMKKVADDNPVEMTSKTFSSIADTAKSMEKFTRTVSLEGEDVRVVFNIFQVPSLNKRMKWLSISLKSGVEDQALLDDVSEQIIPHFLEKYDSYPSILSPNRVRQFVEVIQNA